METVASIETAHPMLTFKSNVAPILEQSQATKGPSDLHRLTEAVATCSHSSLSKLRNRSLILAIGIPRQKCLVEKRNPKRNYIPNFFCIPKMTKSYSKCQRCAHLTKCFLSELISGPCQTFLKTNTILSVRCRK